MSGTTELSHMKSLVKKMDASSCMQMEIVKVKMLECSLLGRTLHSGSIRSLHSDLELCEGAHALPQQIKTVSMCNSFQKSHSTRIRNIRGLVWKESEGSDTVSMCQRNGIIESPLTKWSVNRTLALCCIGTATVRANL